MFGSLLGASLWLDKHARNFAADEEGASTIEMVVLMAASISLSLAVMDKVTNGVENLSNDISSFLSDYEIRTSFDDPVEESNG
jgi:Flp pilus assembly pilin Flp